MRVCSTPVFYMHGGIQGHPLIEEDNGMVLQIILTNFLRESSNADFGPTFKISLSAVGGYD